MSPDRLHAAARAWCEASLAVARELLPIDRTATPGYVDLMFAVGLARLGDHVGANRLVSEARRVFDGLPDDRLGRALAAGWAADAYAARVEQAAAGRHFDPLPAAVLERLNALPDLSGSTLVEGWMAGHAARTLRFISRLLEPVIPVNPYRWSTDTRPGVLAAELEATASAELAQRVRELDTGPFAVRADLFAAALPLTPGAEAAVARELVGQLADMLAAARPGDADGYARVAGLLAQGLAVAVGCGDTDGARRLAGLIVELAAGRVNEGQRFNVVATAAVPALRALRALGLADDLGRLADRLPGAAFGDRPLNGAGDRFPATLRGLAVSAALAVATGWHFTGQADRAAPVLAEAERLLTGPDGGTLSGRDYPAVAAAYLAAAGVGPDGVDRMIELFTALADRRLAGRVRSASTTAAVFSRLHLHVAEAAVLAFAPPAAPSPTR